MESNFLKKIFPIKWYLKIMMAVVNLLIDSLDLCK